MNSHLEGGHCGPVAIVAQVASLAGAGIVLAALVTWTAGIQTQTPPTARQSGFDSAGPIRFQAQPEAPKVTYFLVDTQEEVEQIFRLIGTGESGAPLPWYELVYGLTPRERMVQQKLLDDAAAWDQSTLTVVDMRGR